jgi:alpha-beta hydrolase superfamily lysophospholipase
MLKMKQGATLLLIGFMWRWVAGLTRRYLFNQFFSPDRYPLSAAQRRILEKGERFSIQVNEKTVKCWKWGSGPAILFAHGWNGRGIHFHHFFERLLTNGYSAIAFDAPAHGESEGRTTNYFELTDTVRAILRSNYGANINGAVAHSLGGAAVINAWAKEGCALKMVLIAPALKLKECMEIGQEEAVLNNTQFSNEDVMGKILETLVSLFPQSLQAKLRRCS